MALDAANGRRTWKLPMVLGGISLFSIGISIILIVKSTQTNSPIEFLSNKEILSVSNEASVSAKREKLIHVDVEGGVRAPGLYEFSTASRIEDAIAKAGGLSEEADEEAMAKQLNRASVLVDGTKIYVPKKSDTQKSYNPGTLLQHTSESQNVPININTASENELDALPGVGPVTAKKIIDHRPYQTLEELVSKKAIGNALFEKIKEKLSL